MKILLINTVYQSGSTGKIVRSLHDNLLQQGHEAIVCYGRGKTYRGNNSLVKISSGFEMYLHAILTRITGFQGIYSYFATRRILRLLENFKPEIVHLFNLHGYYINEFKLLGYLKHKRIKTIYSMLDEYPYMGKCCYSFDCTKFMTRCNQCPQVSEYPRSLFFDRSERIFELKKEAYKNFKNIIFTGPGWVLERAGRSSLLRDMSFAEVDEFVDMENVFYPRETLKLRNKLGIGADKKIVLNVAIFSEPRKGGIYYLDCARMMDNENIVFIHVGYDGKKTGLPASFVPVRYVEDQHQLAMYYSLADLFVCTSLADTMPNVCLESLACGTPVCGFDIAGTPLVATPEFGHFTPAADLISLSAYIESAPFKTNERSLACRAYAEMRYSKQIFFSKIMSLY